MLALGALLVAAALNAVVFSWGSQRRHATRTELEAALHRYTALTELRLIVLTEARRIQTTASLVGLDDAAPEERARFLSQLRSWNEPLRVLQRRPTATARSRVLAAKVSRLRHEWRMIYVTSDAASAVQHLVIAEPLAEEVLTADFPAVITEANAEMQRAMTTNNRTDAAVRLLTWAILLASVIFTFVVVGWLSRRLIDDVQALRAGAERVGGGQLGHKIAIHSRDELGRVALSFNTMSVRLRKSQDELQAKHRELDDTLARLRAAQDEVVQSEKLSALGTMLAGLAHELNNPLAAVLSSSEVLAQELAESKDAEARKLGRDVATHLVREAVRARGLVQNLLRFARDTHLELRAVDLADVLTQAMQLEAHAYTQANLAYHFHLGSGLRVKAEPVRLQQICLNIVSNARDAMSQGGGTLLRITARQEDQGWVHVDFEDDGPGLTNPDRVFEPFYTTKPVGEGTGLGLALVYRLVTEFGGTVRAENRAGGGARFIIMLPCAEAGEALARPTPTSMPALAAGGARVLVVDDEPALRMLQERMLRRAGCIVQVACNAQEAQAAMMREAPDLVISDLKMPGELDGLGLYDWAVAADSRMACRFMFVTGDVDDKLLARFGAQSAERVLRKPFSQIEYLQTVAARLLAIQDATQVRVREEVAVP